MHISDMEWMVLKELTVSKDRSMDYRIKDTMVYDIDVLGWDPFDLKKARVAGRARDVVWEEDKNGL